MIHVNRSGTSLGIFSEEDVRAGLRAGRFAPTDLGWREGMAQWQPLAQFPEFAADLPSTPPPPPGAPPGTVPSPTAVVPSTAAMPAPRSGLPWENRQTRGFFPAFFETLVMILTKPTEAFVAMRREGGLADPLIYGLIGGCFGYIVYMLFLLLVPSIAIMGDHGNPLGGIIGAGFGMVAAIVLIPVALTILLFIGSAIVHVCLMIVGGANQSYETTFRVLCYAVGSTYPLIIVPFCGGLIAGIWGLVLEIIGLARAHETDAGRAALAIFLPLIVCCGFGLVLAVMMGFLAQGGS